MNGVRHTAHNVAETRHRADGIVKKWKLEKRGKRPMAKRGQNEGSIYQRKDGRWVAQINLGWLNGKRVRKSYYADTRKDVHEQLTKAVSDIQKGLAVVGDKQSVSDYLVWWLEN